MRLLLDTNICIEILRGRDSALLARYASLPRAGMLIGSHDLMIASTALAHGLTVVTRNINEFRRIETLAIEDWRV